ncbi:hypothetical protein RclHR1_05430002 [Rhizophagus clarus]|uniref:Uncharacterized protein n=1 Tax=Rhizophagus clarus TaxID=94130 RepID=A0A2Z6S5L0_9GLOM|nr:hypothetical protein RclHR1_10920010 [Rhizophagus clarus]GBC03972.1 hypothetical protein RclHR1_05430002 [Rhizophagus clarus]
MPNHYERWSRVLERTFLRYIWTKHAQEYTYSTQALRDNISIKQVEGLLLEHSSNSRNNSTQECNSPNNPRTKVIQKKASRYWTSTDFGKMMADNNSYSTGEQSMISPLSPDEHMSNDYPIPELLIKEITNLEKYNSEGKLNINVKLSLWTNTNYGYYNDADIFSINFTRKADVLHDYCDHINNLLVCYVLNNKIISIQIFDASTLLYCHLHNYDEPVDDKPPLSLYSIYCEDHDELSLYFTDCPPTTTLMNIEVEKDVLIRISNNGKLVALLIRNAQNRIARVFLKEDRERLLDEFELRALALQSSLSNNTKNYNICCCTIL